jgi:putative transposase
MIAFIDDHRGVHGVEPICKVLPIAPSSYHDHLAKRVDPTRLSARARRDAELSVQIRRVFDENFGVYGVRKVWRQMRREGFDVARCTVARLMKAMGIEGIIRGKSVKTTIPDRAAPCPLDRVNRQFRVPAPNRLWVSDFTYVATWQGFVYVAFVIDAFARRIVGWRASRTAHAGFVLDALEQAVHQRRPAKGTGLVHHSDSQRIEASSRTSGSRKRWTVWYVGAAGCPVWFDPHSDRLDVSFPGPVDPGSTLR